MQSGLRNYTNCPVIIYDINNEHIADSFITEHDKRSGTILIASLLNNLEQGAKVNIIIVHAGGVASYNGSLRKARGEEHEIALYNEKHRQARGSHRHKLNTPGTINNIITKDGKQQLNPPLQVIVVNISTTGTLVKAVPGYFKLGAIIEIHLTIHGKEAILLATVVRETKNADSTINYGCKFMHIDK